MVEIIGLELVLHDCLFVNSYDESVRLAHDSVQLAPNIQ
jgi:hypothetical protein